MAGFAVPQFQFSYQGSPAAAGSVYVYNTGTTTKATVYSDGGLTTPISNPITLDSNGACKFYVAGLTNLRLDAYTSTGTLIESIDPVYPVAPASNASAGYFTTEASIPSASTTDLGSITTTNVINITGNTTITSFGSSANTNNPLYFLRFSSNSPLTYNATSMILPGAGNITVAAGDCAIAKYEGSGNWRVTEYQRASGLTVGMSPITASTSNDVALNNTSNYFAGPSIAQGTSGTWFVSGQVTLNDSAGAASFAAKLWDGTTLIDSGFATSAQINATVCISLSGIITNPAGNITISARDLTSTSGTMLHNISSLGKDSTISAFRIA